MKSESETTMIDLSPGIATPFIAIERHESECPMTALERAFTHSMLFGNPALIERQYLDARRNTAPHPRPYAPGMHGIAGIEVNNSKIMAGVVMIVQHLKNSACGVARSCEEMRYLSGRIARMD
jgi:hypothetical protein